MKLTEEQMRPIIEHRKARDTAAYHIGVLEVEYVRRREQHFAALRLHERGERQEANRILIQLGFNPSKGEYAITADGVIQKLINGAWVEVD